MRHISRFERFGAKSTFENNTTVSIRTLTTAAVWDPFVASEDFRSYEVVFFQPFGTEQLKMRMRLSNL